MARRRYFPGKDVTWLEAKLGVVLEEIAAGAVVSSWGEGDSSASKQVGLSPEVRKRMLLNDLNVLDPANYSLEDYAPITKTKVSFSGLDC